MKQKRVIFSSLIALLITNPVLSVDFPMVSNSTNQKAIISNSLISTPSSYSTNPFYNPNNPLAVPKVINATGTDLTSKDCQTIVQSLVSAYCQQHNYCSKVSDNDINAAIITQLNTYQTTDYTRCQGYILPSLKTYKSSVKNNVSPINASFPVSSIINSAVSFPSYSKETFNESFPDTYADSRSFSQRKNEILSDVQAYKTLDTYKDHPEFNDNLRNKIKSKENEDKEKLKEKLKEALKEYCVVSYGEIRDKQLDLVINECYNDLINCTEMENPEFENIYDSIISNWDESREWCSFDYVKMFKKWCKDKYSGELIIDEFEKLFDFSDTTNWTKKDYVKWILDFFENPTIVTNNPDDTMSSIEQICKIKDNKPELDDGDDVDPKQDDGGDGDDVDPKQDDGDDGDDVDSKNQQLAKKMCKECTKLGTYTTDGGDYGSCLFTGAQRLGGDDRRVFTKTIKFEFTKDNISKKTVDLKLNCSENKSKPWAKDWCEIWKYQEKCDFSEFKKCEYFNSNKDELLKRSKPDTRSVRYYKKCNDL